MKKEIISVTTPDEGSAGVPPAIGRQSVPHCGEITVRNRGRLPHWEKECGTYFVTFRLADSLPAHVLDQIASQRLTIIQTAKRLNRELSDDERRRLKSLSTKRIEQYLDNGVGTCPLKNPSAAAIVALAITHFDGQRYRLFAWCVMPNHVHAVLQVFAGFELAAVIHSWKSYTAHEIKKKLQLQGRLWQREYYDHLIRNEAELEHALDYVEQNPSKAGLGDWRFVWRWGSNSLTTAAGTAALL